MISSTTETTQNTSVGFVFQQHNTGKFLLPLGTSLRLIYAFNCSRTFLINYLPLVDKRLLLLRIPRGSLVGSFYRGTNDSVSSIARLDYRVNLSADTSARSDGRYEMSRRVGGASEYSSNMGNHRSLASACCCWTHSQARWLAHSLVQFTFGGGFVAGSLSH